MTNEEELIELNKMIAKYRAAGDIDAFIVAQATKEAILAKMGEEAEEEYINLYRFFGDKS
tara:strand:+ start:85 stop:264 length:180 start_codon:yes stop_codon:yes gene_type:complete